MNRSSDQLNQLEAQIAGYECLYQVLENVWSASGEADVIRHFIEAALAVGRADQGAIMLYSSAAGTDARTLVRGGEDHRAMLDSYLTHLFAGWVFRQKQPLLTNDLIAVFGEKNIPDKYRNITAVMGIPLSLDDQMVGVMSLISHEPGREFTSGEFDLISLLARHCARFIQNARLQEALFSETNRLKRALHEKYNVQGVIGSSPKLQEVFALLERIIPTEVRVLIEGESGTGKERIARIIHFSGPRKDAPFCPVDCGALPANLLESELFGYVKGAFTGAGQDRPGLLETADGGTLFLDEIGNMPLEIQAKFLRALQEGEFRPLGSSQTRRVQVRVIAATSKHLAEEVQASRFRQDLFYRLNVMPIYLPPLRERREDIPLLAEHFLQQMNQTYQKNIRGFTAEGIRYLESYNWPGNVRELAHAVERAVILAQGEVIDREDLPDFFAAAGNANDLFQPRPLQDAVNDFKKRYLEQVLTAAGGVQSKAAAILDIQRTYLNRLLKELGIR